MSTSSQVTFTTNDNYIDYDSVDYDIDENARPIQSMIGKRLTFQQLSEGVEFELDEKGQQEIEAEDEEVNRLLDLKNKLLTRDQIFKNLADNPLPDDEIPGVEDPSNYEQRIAGMSELVPGMVYKRVLKAGSGPEVSLNSSVLYHLNGYLENLDEPFDSTWLRGKPNLHHLSSDTILPGLLYGLKSMKSGERCELMVRPDYAFLAMGCPPRVPPNATVLFIVELLRVYTEGTLSYYDSLSWEDKSKFDFNHLFKLCDEERISGNTYFKDNKYNESAFRYRRAIRCMEGCVFAPENENKGKDLLLALYCNIANAYNKLSRPLGAMGACKKALEIDKQSAKALYHYGYAKLLHGDLNEAKDLLLRAKVIEPNSQSIASALNKLEHRLYVENQAEKDLCIKMCKAFKPFK